MDRPSKRHKPNPDLSRHGEGGGEGEGDSNSNDIHHKAQESHRFAGQGVSNHNGTIDIGRDLVIQGFNHADQPIIENFKQAILESLRFKQIETRLTTIKRAHANTCQWLLKNPQYMDWLDKEKLGDHRGFLWIKGKPGVGKSTLMKYAFNHVRNHAFQAREKEIVISFFFNARGDDLERSTTGLFRSLLLQLFEARPTLKSVLDHIGFAHQWTIESLKSLFEETVLQLKDGSLTCFIDALDECDEMQIRDMVSFLSELTVPTGTELRICLASRHYPHITLKKGLNLILEGQVEHRHDIARYMDSKLQIGQTTLAKQIHNDLQDKASGVFMWVVLVVEILNREYDQGRKHSLREKLGEIPSDLHELFKQILTRDQKNRSGLLICIQWILFAKHPLTPQQLYFAIISGDEPDSLTYCHSDEISGDDMRKYILDNSKGLAEYTKSSSPRIQFIHESVKDFLLKDNGLAAIWPNLVVNLPGQSHETLKNCCLRYMRVGPIISHIESSPILDTYSDQIRRLCGDVGTQFPFLEYALENLLYHSNEAHINGIHQEDFLRNFPQDQWREYHNLFVKHDGERYSPNVSLLYILAERNMSNLVRALPSGQSCFLTEHERYGTPIFAALAARSDQAAQACLEVQAEAQALEYSTYDVSSWRAYKEARFISFDCDFFFERERGIISHIAEHGNDVLLTIFLATESGDINLVDGNQRPPISWAADRGKEAIVRILLENGALVDAHDGNGKTLLLSAITSGSEATVRLLLVHGAQIEAQVSNGRTPLSWAASYGHCEIVRLLLENGAQIDFRDSSGFAPLFWAVSSGSDETVQLLLNNGANTEVQDPDGWTPLFWAAFYAQEVLVRLLLENGARTEVQDKVGRTILSCVAARPTEAIIRLLLSYGAQIEAHDNNCRTPLSWAATNGSRSNLRLLLEYGAQIEAQDNNCRTPLSWAASHGSESNLRLLLEYGAQIEAQDNDCRTPLSWAASHGSKSNLCLLLDNGAHTEACDSGGRAPLSWAAGCSSEATLRLLLEYGAQIEAQDNSGRTPLSWAAGLGSEETVRLLIANGAQTEVQDSSGRTPLSWAAAFRVKAIVQLLLDNGAHIETQDNRGRTPLFWATAFRFKAIIQLLLDNGAQIETQDNHGRTPLSWAAGFRSRAIVQLLLANAAQIDAQDNHGRTPLSWAAKSGSEKTLRLLLDNGAQIEAHDSSGWTPLWWAVARGREATARLLLEKGAQIEARDSSGWTPLWRAATYDYEAIARLLLQKGAQVDARDNNGLKLLQWVMERGNETIVQLLFEHGAQIEAQDSSC